MQTNYHGKKIPPFLLYPFQKVYRQDLCSLGVTLLEVDGEENEYISEYPVKLKIEEEVFDVEEGLDLESRQDIFSLQKINVKELRIEVGDKGFDLDYLLYNSISDEDEFSDEEEFNDVGYVLIHRVPLDQIDCGELAEYTKTFFSYRSGEETWLEKAFDFFHESLREPIEHFKYMCNKHGAMLSDYLKSHRMEGVTAIITIKDSKFNIEIIEDDSYV